MMQLRLVKQRAFQGSDPGVQALYYKIYIGAVVYTGTYILDLSNHNKCNGLPHYLQLRLRLPNRTTPFAPTVMRGRSPGLITDFKRNERTCWRSVFAGRCKPTGAISNTVH